VHEVRSSCSTLPPQALAREGFCQQHPPARLAVFWLSVVPPPEGAVIIGFHARFTPAYKIQCSVALVFANPNSNACAVGLRD